MDTGVVGWIKKLTGKVNSQSEMDFELYSEKIVYMYINVRSLTLSAVELDGGSCRALLRMSEQSLRCPLDKPSM